MAKAAAATDVDSGDAAPCQKVYYVLNIVVVLCCSPAIQQRATTIACMGIQAHEVHAHPAANNIYIALSIVEHFHAKAAYAFIRITWPRLLIPRMVARGT